jgi:hypothetical protein
MARPSKAITEMLGQFDGDALDALDIGLRSKYGVGLAEMARVGRKIRKHAKYDVRTWLREAGMINEQHATGTRSLRALSRR